MSIGDRSPQWVVDAPVALAWETCRVQLRPRLATDLPACVEALIQVHRADGYPSRWPSDPAAWLSPPNLLAAWVADGDVAIVGHVVIAAANDGSLGAATGRAVDHLLSVERLFIAPSARRAGLARALLFEAASLAEHENKGLVLEVVDDASAAVALYEGLGWHLIGRRPASWTTVAGQQPVLRLYAAP